MPPRATIAAGHHQESHPWKRTQTQAPPQKQTHERQLGLDDLRHAFDMLDLHKRQFITRADVVRVVKNDILANQIIQDCPALAGLLHVNTFEDVFADMRDDNDTVSWGEFGGYFMKHQRTERASPPISPRKPRPSSLAANESDFQLLFDSCADGGAVTKAAFLTAVSDAEGPIREFVMSVPSLRAVVSAPDLNQAVDDFATVRADCFTYDEFRKFWLSMLSIHAGESTEDAAQALKADYDWSKATWENWTEPRIPGSLPSFPVTGWYTEERRLLELSVTTCVEPHRQRLQDELVYNTIRGVPSSERPQLVVIGGVLGSGRAKVRSHMDSIGILIAELTTYIDLEHLSELLPEFGGYSLLQMHHDSVPDARNATIKEAKYLTELATYAAMLRLKATVCITANFTNTLDSQGDYAFWTTTLEKVRTEYPQYRMGLVLAHSLDEDPSEAAAIASAEGTWRKLLPWADWAAKIDVPMNADPPRPVWLSEIETRHLTDNAAMMQNSVPDLEKKIAVYCLAAAGTCDVL
mmetsp:Transcript_94767/g.216804  ORF Transcript_94767/g.216804 Transcript_94767/m.216804 type:complete len:523 (-) Transcript_94767:273-1841(-)